MHKISTYLPKGGQTKLFFLFFFFLMNFNAKSQSTLLAGWDFQTTTNGGTAMAAAPSSPTTINANFGSGTIYLNGTNGSSTWTTATSGNELNSFGGSAVNAGTGFSTTTSGASCLALVNATTTNSKYLIFKVNMSTFSNLIISYATQRTSTGFTTQTWDYSTNGTSFTNFSTQTTLTTSYAVRTLSAVPSAVDNQSAVYIRLKCSGATGGAGGNNRLDNIQFNATAAASCNPTKLGLTSSVSTYNQDAPFNITVQTEDTSNTLQTCCTNGTVTLVANNACGLFQGSTLATIGNTLTANVTNGVATFSNLKFSRSLQNNISFTATYSGSCGSLTSVTSSSFVVNQPTGTFSQIVLKNETFDVGNIPWNYTIGTPIYSGTTGGGVDYTGLKNYSGNNVLVKSHSTDNPASGKKSTNTIEFDNVSGLASYTSLKFSFKVASLDKPGGIGGAGVGTDGGENFVLEVSTNNGTSWTPILTEKGSSDRMFPFTSIVNNLVWGSSTIYSSPDNKSSFLVNIPSGTNDFKFRITATSNRTQENWAIDDIKLVGEVLISATSQSLLPTTIVSNQISCPSVNATLTSVTSDAISPTYSWSGTGSITGSTTSSSLIANAGTYTLTLTDADACISTASASITQSAPIEPTVTDGSICSGATSGTVYAQGALSGQLYKWYDASLGGTLLYTSSSNTDDSYTSSPTVTTSFWVSILDAAGCESNRTQVNLIVSTLPSSPSVSNVNVCDGLLANMSATGAIASQDYYWYTTNTGGNAIANGSSFTTSPVNFPTTSSYYVSILDINTGCESVRIQGDAIPQSATPILSSLATNNLQSLTIDHTDGRTVNYYQNVSCEYLAKITDASGGNVLGNTTVKSTLLAATPLPVTTNAQTFSTRYYDINPTSPGAATVTLYYTHQDFVDYNATNGTLDMPNTMSNSDSRIGNMRIAQMTTNGTLSFTTNYLATLNWNATTNLWEATFNVPNLIANGRYYFYGAPNCDLIVDNATININSITSTTALVSWTAVAGSTGYLVRWKTTGNSVWNSTSTSTNSRTLSMLLPGSNYEVQIRTICANNSGSWNGYGLATASTNFTTSGVLATCNTPIMSPASNVTTTGATLNWQASTTSSSNISTYYVRWRVVGSNSWTAAYTSQLNRIIPLSSSTSATNYEAQVMVYCNGTSASYSAWSALVNFTTPGTTILPVCNTPTGLAASSISSINAIASWNSVSNINSYQILWSVQGSGTWASAYTASTSRTLTPLVANTIYDMKVKSYCTGTSNGASAFSPIVTFSTGANAKPLETEPVNSFISIYPNPTTAYFTVQFNSEINCKQQINIYDIAGRLVLSTFKNIQVGNNIFEINMNNQANGLYTIQLLENNKVKYISKLVKN